MSKGFKYFVILFVIILRNFMKFSYVWKYISSMFPKFEIKLIKF